MLLFLRAASCCLIRIAPETSISIAVSRWPCDAGYCHLLCAPAPRPAQRLMAMPTARSGGGSSRGGEGRGEEEEVSEQRVQGQRREDVPHVNTLPPCSTLTDTTNRLQFSLRLLGALEGWVTVRG